MPHPSHSRKVHRFGKLLVPKHRNRVYLCPVSADSHSKVPAEPTDQMRTVLSKLPEASLVPSGENATL